MLHTGISPEGSSCSSIHTDCSGSKQYKPYPPAIAVPVGKLSYDADSSGDLSLLLSDLAVSVIGKMYSCCCTAHAAEAGYVLTVQEIGVEIENPFGGKFNHLPVSSFSRTPSCLLSMKHGLSSAPIEGCRCNHSPYCCTVENRWGHDKVPCRGMCCCLSGSTQFCAALSFLLPDYCCIVLEVCERVS